MIAFHGISPCGYVLLALAFTAGAQAQQPARQGCNPAELTEEDSLRLAIYSTIGGTGDSPIVPVSLTIFNQNVVCLTAERIRDEYRFASVVVLFSCVGPVGAGSPLGSQCVPDNYTAQFDFECRDSVTSPGVSWQRSLTPFGFGNGSTAVFFNPPDANFSTGLDTYCSLCVDPNRFIPNSVNGAAIPIDPITHCAGKQVLY